VPLSVAEKSAEVEPHRDGIEADHHPNMASDLTTAIALARAAVAGAIANVEINLDSIKSESAGSQEFVGVARSRVQALKAGAASAPGS